MTSELYEVEIQPLAGQIDREAERVCAEAAGLGAASVREVRTAKSFLLQGPLSEEQVRDAAIGLLVDTVVEEFSVCRLSGDTTHHSPLTTHQLNVLYRPGVTDNVAASAKEALLDRGLAVEAVATCRKYWINADAAEADLDRLAAKVLANDSIERVIRGPLRLGSLSLGTPYQFKLNTVPIRGMDDGALGRLSREGQLYLNLAEMQTLRRHFIEAGRDPTDIELETIAQTWSEHCSHKTLTGPVRYREQPTTDDGQRTITREIRFDNLLKETIFAATETIRRRLGENDWCVSVFEDNAGIVRFDEKQNVCMKVETHNHPSAIEPYGGANTGVGGVIRDPLGTGLGARPVCNTDVFCFAPPDVAHEDLPPGVLHPLSVLKGVVAGVRDYGNRMGIPTVNGAVYFDERYLGNPLVYCGNVAMIPAEKCRKHMQPGDLIVAVGGRTGRDGIHGATFSSAELTHESESLSGGAVQIGDAVTEKKLADAVLAARDRGLYSAITDCGAGGFSSAVGEMGAETGAEVWLEKAPLKYEGLSYTEIWISEAQERMVLAVPERHWNELHELCAEEGVEATVIGRFTDTGRLLLKYDGTTVGDLSMDFLHKGRPRIEREAVFVESRVQSPESRTRLASDRSSPALDSGLSTLDSLKAILSSPNVCSREWIIRQYDHEVQSGSVVKPLVGAACDGPSDAAVLRPNLASRRGLVIACGMNPRYGDFDPYWMAASAIDEAVRNCVAVGADPRRIAILDNFCWGNTDRPEVLGTLVRAAIACRDAAIAYGTPFISGKDSLNNEFAWGDAAGATRTVAIPPSLLISALGQIEDVARAVTMDLKEPGNAVYLVGQTKAELCGSHLELVTGECRSSLDPAIEKPSIVNRQSSIPKWDLDLAPRIFAALHGAIAGGLVRSCHDLSEGGLAVAAAEMAFAGELGVELDLRPLAAASDLDDEAALLFSESNTRFLVEVAPDRAARFESLFQDLPLTRLGRVAEHERVRVIGLDASPAIDAPWSELKAAWKQPLAEGLNQN